MIRLAVGLTILLGLFVIGAASECAEAPAKVDAGTTALIGLLPELGDPAAQLDILRGIRAGLQGQRAVAPPPNWEAIYREHLARSENAEVRDLARLLSLQFGEETVRKELLDVVADEEAPLAQRREALLALTEVRAKELPDALLALLGGSAVRADALRALAEFSSPDATAAIIRAYPTFGLEEKRIAIDALSSGVGPARALLKAVKEQRIPRTELGAETIRRLRLLGDEKINEAISAHWGTVRETLETKAARIAALKQLLSAPSDREPDLPHGRALFAKTCRQCHVLYGDGEKVGPEITGSNRGDLDYLLINVVDPNSTVGKDYQAWSVMTEAGKLYVGLVAEENDQVLTLRTETDTIHIPQDEIESRELTSASMMPEGLFDHLPDEDLRDLVAYLRGSWQVPLLATPEIAGQFFNGEDLRHWREFGGSWQVKDGRIHATQAAAASKDAVLISDLLLHECIIEMEVRLAATEGSAGIALVPWAASTNLSDLHELPSPLVVLGLGDHGNVSIRKALGEVDVIGSVPGETSKDWHSVRIARSADGFSVTIDGRERIVGAGDAIPRFRLAFVLEAELEGELFVRRLRLLVPQPGTVE